MSKERFEHLHSLVEPLIKKQDTMFRKPIPTRERLGIVLRYLSSGCSQQDLSFNLLISRTTVSKIVPETCDAIYEHLPLSVYEHRIQRRNGKKSVINAWKCGTCLT